MKNSIDIFISKFFICVFTLILIYIFYSSEVKYGFNRTKEFIPYYVITILVITFFIIILYQTQKIRINCLLIFFSLSISIYLLEIFLQFNIYLKDSNKNIQDIDLRDKYEVYKELKKENKNITPNIWAYVPSRLKKNITEEILPLSGLPNRLTLYCNENGYWSTFQSDRHGFNNFNETWDNPNVEVITLGDSFTLGACVYREENISYNLMINLNTNLINLGYGGGPLVQLATLTEYGSHLKPEKIFWFFYEGNDYSDLQYEIKIPFLINYLNNKENSLIKKQEIINNKLEKIFYEEHLGYLKKISDDKNKNIISSIIKLQRIRQILNVKNILVKKNIIDNAKTKSNLENIYSVAKSLTEDWNGQIYLIYLPEFNRYAKRNYSPFINKNELFNILDRVGINYIDIDQELFIQSDNPKSFFPFQKKGHYTPEGYKKIAKFLSNYLIKLKN